MSRYGSLMDYDRRKLQKQCRVMEKQELLLLAVDLEAGMAERGESFPEFKGTGNASGTLDPEGKPGTAERNWAVF